LMFYIRFSTNIFEFFKELPSNTKYFITGIWSGEITFCTTINGCINCLIWDKVDTMCFFMTILAIIYFRR
jgi:hypothetical protein